MFILSVVVMLEVEKMSNELVKVYELLKRLNGFVRVNMVRSFERW